MREREYSKKKLALIWVLGGYFFSILGVIPAVIYWEYVNPDWKLEIIGEVMASSVMLPFGWFFCAIIPLAFPASAMCWLSIAAFVWACKSKRLAPLYVSFGACLIFGLFWPKAFWAMMSV